MRSLHDYRLHALDGEIGRVVDFYIDDRQWAVRYLVADTGNWLLSRKVLISPVSLGKSDWGLQNLNVGLTRDQVKESPPVNTELPVSRQQEIEFHRHHAWPYYWVGGGLWGAAGHPAALVANPGNQSAVAISTDSTLNMADEQTRRSYVRSLNELEGYAIQAIDGKLGKIRDFVVDEESWKVRYLVVSVGWLPNRKVLVSTDWIDWVSWGDKEVRVDLTMDVVRNSPEYDPDAAVNRELEVQLYDYYGRPKYWL